MFSIAANAAIMTALLNAFPAQEAPSCDMSQLQLAVQKAEVERTGLISGPKNAEVRPRKGDRLVIVTIPGSIPARCMMPITPSLFVVTWPSGARFSDAARWRDYFGLDAPWAMEGKDWLPSLRFLVAARLSNPLLQLLTKSNCVNLGAFSLVKELGRFPGSWKDA